MPAALGVETFHNFTLVHDDIMDRAETRRGRPCVHTTWGEAEAILAGDLMHGIAARLVHETPLGGAAGREARARCSTAWWSACAKGRPSTWRSRRRPTCPWTTTWA